jgi:hypothetical protein
MAREFAIGSHFSRVSSDGTDPGQVTLTGDCAQNPVNELSRVESRTGAVTVASRWLVGWAFASPASIRFGLALFPVPAHRTGQADFPHPALGKDARLINEAREHALLPRTLPFSQSDRL